MVPKAVMAPKTLSATETPSRLYSTPGCLPLLIDMATATVEYVNDMIAASNEISFSWLKLGICVQRRQLVRVQVVVRSYGAERNQ